MSEDAIAHFDISVVIPAYNIEEYIGRAIDSVLVQTYQPREIIVVDDGSTDATAQKIGLYGDKVRYIYQENRGLSGARNTGIREARYDWIAFLDGDDEWLPKHLELQISVLRQNSELKWCTGNCIHCLCDEDRRGAYVCPETIKEVMRGTSYFESYFEASLHKASGNSNTMIIHKCIFDTVGLFNEKQAFAEDLEMWWRITFEYPQIGYVAEPIAIYHMQRPGTLTEEFKKTKMRWLIDLVERNLRIASEKNMGDKYGLLVGRMIRSWVRGLLFDNRPQEVKELLVRFDRYLSTRFKLLIRILMLWPKATAHVCHQISKIIRRFKLRKKIVRPPS